MPSKPSSGSSVGLERRLAALLRLIPDGATIDEVRSDAGVARGPVRLIEVRPVSSFGREMGFTDPPEDKNLNALALTRFPAGIPRDRAIELEKTLGIPASEAPYSILVNQDKKNTPLLKLTENDAELTDPWAPHEIINALYPVLARAAKLYTSGGWNKTKDSFDRNAFEDFIQNGRMAVLRAIDSQEDRGDPYLPWIKVAITGLVAGGTTVDSATNAASGFYGKLIKASKPEQIDALLADPENGIDPQDVNGTPRKPREGNRYGEHAPELYRVAVAMRNALASRDPEDIDATRDMLATDQEALKNHGRILGARTGQYDTISTPKTDTRQSRFLTKLTHVNNMDQLQAIGQPDKSTKELYDKYVAALQSNNTDALDDVRQEISEWLREKGDRDSFRREHKRTGVKVTGASGAEVDNPDLPSKSDSFKKDIGSKEIVKKLLIAGLRGVQTDEIDGNGDRRVITINEREFRIIIRMFGISDYPYKGTSKDPEFDFKKFEEMHDALLKTVGSNDPDLAVTVEPMNAAEARWMKDMATKQVATSYDEWKKLDDELEGLWRDYDKMLLMVPDEDIAEAVAEQQAYSQWVRRGCPQLTTGEISKDLLGDGAHHSTIGKAMEKLIGVPKRKQKGVQAYDQKFVGPGGADHDSKLYRIAQAMKKELDIDENDPEFLARSRRPVGVEEAVRKTVLSLAESALWKLYKVSDFYANKAAITEGVDLVDARLLADARKMIGSYLNGLYDNGASK